MHHDLLLLITLYLGTVGLLAHQHVPSQREHMRVRAAHEVPHAPAEDFVVGVGWHP